MACHSDVPASAQQNRPREEAGGAKEAPPPKQVKVARVLDTPLERTTAALGSLVALIRLPLASKSPGRLRSITVDLGSLVQRGQLIARLSRRITNCACNRRKRL